MATMRMARECAVRVTVGVDTHKDAHVARERTEHRQSNQATRSFLAP